MTRTKGLIAIIGVLVVVFAAVAYGFYREAADAHQLAVAIQRSRLAVAHVECVSQNRRHDRTVAELKVLDRRAEKQANPQRRRLIQTSQAGTILLIDALAPHRDCAQLFSLIHTS